MSWTVMATIVGIGVAMSVLFIRTHIGGWLTILILTMVIALGYGVVATRDADADKEREQAQLVARATQQAVHDQCVEKIARSQGNHDQWEDTADYLVSKGLLDAAEYIRYRLQQNLPVIDPASCPPAPPPLGTVKP